MATFHIETDRQSYFPGDKIEGRVLANISASIILKFTGLQSIKWRQKIQTIAQNFANQLQQSNSANKSENKLQQQAYHVHQLSDLSVSQCHTEQKNQDLRPKFIKTPQNKYYQLNYHQKVVQISKGIIQLMPAGKIQAGQYSFPFSLSTNAKWPASFKCQSSQRKINIKYYLIVTLEPFSPRFQFKAAKQIILYDKQSCKKVSQFQSQVSSLYCIKKGRAEYRVSLDKDGYCPNDNGEVVLQLDNTNCEVDIQSVTVALKYTQKLKLGSQTSETRQIFRKQLNCGTKAGQSSQGSKSQRVPFTLPKALATAQAQIITSSYSLQIQLKHDALFYKNEIHNIPFTVYVPKGKSEIPWEMKTKWQPKTIGFSKLPVSNLEVVLNSEHNLK